MAATAPSGSAASQDALRSAQSYYGDVLQGSGDLKTSACCSAAPKDASVKTALARVHPDVVARFYGCGSPIPPLLRGEAVRRSGRAKTSTCCSGGASGQRIANAQPFTVLDLGCGTGRDCFILSQLLGPSGQVIGVDATKEQLGVAQNCLGWHQERNPQSAPMDFRLGAIEDLSGAGVEDESVDVIISNCVLNLSNDKPRLFSELFRVLKPGGELLFSDVFANVRLPKALLQDPVLHGECLAGAMHWPDMLALMAENGGFGAREVESSPVELYDEKLLAMLEPGTVFESKTVRAFKRGAAITNGETASVAPAAACVAALANDEDVDDVVRFDSTTSFRKGDPPQWIDGDIASLIRQTRYARFFTMEAASSIKDANGSTPSSQPPSANSGGCCGSSKQKTACC